MLKVDVSKLKGSPLDTALELLHCYSALREAAIRDNNLRIFLEADLASESLRALMDHANHTGRFAGAYLKAESKDSIPALMRACAGYRPIVAGG